MLARAIQNSLLILALSYPVLAENAEKSRGVLPDGRAFRTDADGNQLVDYIAELEVGVETLNRQLESAQEELREKDSALSNCRSGTKEGLKERSLPVPGQVPGSLAPAALAPDSKNPPAGCVVDNSRLIAMEAALQSLRDDRDMVSARLGGQLEACRTELATITSTRASLSPKGIENLAAEAAPEQFRLDESGVAAQVEPRPAFVPPVVSDSTIKSVRIEREIPVVKDRSLDGLRGNIYTQLNRVRTAAMACGRTTGASACGEAMLSIEQLRRRAATANDLASLSAVNREIQSIKATVDSAVRAGR